jgi:Phosphoenolpyruvate carboxykinase (ATP)
MQVRNLFFSSSHDERERITLLAGSTRRVWDDYIYILEDLMQAHQTRCFLVNAGWHGENATWRPFLSASEESAVITSLYYCTDWESFGALGLEVPAGQSERGPPPRTPKHGGSLKKNTNTDCVN